MVCHWLVALYPAVKHTESKWALGGVAIFTVALVVLIVAKSFIQKYISKIPYTLTAFAAMLAILLLLRGLKQIIDDAIIIFFVGVLGASVGFVLELAYMRLEAMADEIEENI